MMYQTLLPMEDMKIGYLPDGTLDMEWCELNHRHGDLVLEWWDGLWLWFKTAEMLRSDKLARKEWGTPDQHEFHKDNQVTDQRRAELDVEVPRLKAAYLAVKAQEEAMVGELVAFTRRKWVNAHLWPHFVTSLRRWHGVEVTDG